MAAPEGYGFDFLVPPELLGGVYAHALQVWYSRWDFSLDFGAAIDWPEEAGDHIPSVAVARVRIPVTLIFDVLKALNGAMTSYEREHGEIGRSR